MWKAAPLFLFLGFPLGMAHAEELILSALDLPKYVLGTGFDSQSNQFREACVTGDPVYAGDQEARLNLESALDTKQLQEEIAGEVGAGINLGLVGGGVSTKIASLMGKREHSHDLYYTQGYKRTVILNNVRLTERGRDAVASQDPSYVRLICGDSYIEQIQLGGRAILNVHIYFANKDLKNTFTTTFKVKVLWKTFTKSKVWTDHKVSDQSRVQFELIQYGGDPNLALQAKNSGQSHCAFNALEDCSKALEDLFRYTSVEFPQQLHQLDYDEEGRFSPLNYRVKPYKEISELGLAGETRFLTPTVQEALTKLKQDLGELSSQLSLAQNLLAHWDLGDEERRQVASTVRRIQFKQAQLESAVLTCLAARQCLF